jgi:hypothetical protein
MITKQIRVNARYAELLARRARRAGLSLPRYTALLVARMARRRRKARPLPPPTVTAAAAWEDEKTDASTL